VFFGDPNYNDESIRLSDIPVTSLKRITPHILNKTVNYYSEKIANDFTNSLTASYSQGAQLCVEGIEHLLQYDLLNTEDVLNFFDIVKYNSSLFEKQLLTTLLTYSNNDVLLDYLTTLPLDEQTDILYEKEKLPADVLQNYFKEFIKCSKIELENGCDKIQISPKQHDVLMRCLKDVKLSNSDYDYFFNKIDVSTNFLLAVTEKDNAIPDNVLIKLIQRERQRDVPSFVHKTPQIVVQMLTNLYCRHSKLPPEVINLLYITHYSNTVQSSLKDYEKAGNKFVYNTIKSKSVEQIAQSFKELDISREEFLNLIKEISNGFKNTVDSIQGIPFPHEKTFADFFEQHMEKMIDLAILNIKRKTGDFKNLNEQEMRLVFKSFDDLIPDELDNPFVFFEKGDFSLYEDDCIVFNEEGQLFLKAVKQMELIKSEQNKDISQKQETSR
jgi:hypothetical protein